MQVVTEEDIQNQLNDIDNGLACTFIDHSRFGKLPPLPYSNPSATRAQKGSFEGELFDSMAECIVYLYYKYVQGCLVERNKNEYIDYVASNGRLRKFYPDLKVNGQFVEIKGRYWSDDYKKRQIQMVKWIDVGSDEYNRMVKAVNRALPRWKSEYLKTGGKY